MLGYGGMILEGVLAVLVILAVTSGVTQETWLKTYANYAKVPTLPTFAEGGARIAFRKGANVIWPLFGATNQLLAGLALLVTAYLAKQKKPLQYTMVPMVFMVVMTTWGMVANLLNYVAKGDWLLTVIDAIVIVLELWLIAEAWAVIRRVTSNKAPSQNTAA
ncbi:MAG: hypothetical protein IMF26_01755 [Candidatus Fermentithermobacillus carboniphilus]|uniref:CstA N-terminal domain-containing protein n=1 Tax=Candidatus Fermentithermobacillus carboniphilus TaxID=3085328 RepID=A0AAT9LCN8_9FIRM|nr:MAG: hypothetical protein IMF26_01755 [Candidatus Fermentithermobacillus carboniphilus]